MKKSGNNYKGKWKLEVGTAKIL